jgi:hypothetical protein
MAQRIPKLSVSIGLIKGEAQGNSGIAALLVIAVLIFMAKWMGFL